MQAGVVPLRDAGQLPKVRGTIGKCLTRFNPRRAGSGRKMQTNGPAQMRLIPLSPALSDPAPLNPPPSSQNP